MAESRNRLCRITLDSTSYDTIFFQKNQALGGIILRSLRERIGNLSGQEERRGQNGCAALAFENGLSLGNERLDFRHQVGAVIRIDLHLDRLCQIEREDPHDGFCVDRIPAGHQVHVKIIFGYDVYKIFHVIDCVKFNYERFHLVVLLT